MLNITYQTVTAKINTIFGEDNLVTYNNFFFNVYILYPAIPLLGIHPIEIRVIHERLLTRMLL